ncbi:MAG: ferritin-like domain-containing protein [Candidatus Sericytochromatia bacterium]
MSLAEKALNNIPKFAQNTISNAINSIDINPKVLYNMLPSLLKGFVLKQGKQNKPILIKSGHDANFDFSYSTENPQMYELYRRAIENQWNGETKLDWSIDVDPHNPEKLLLPDSFFPFDKFESHGIRLNKKEKLEFKHSVTSWMLSQFLHGEQGALFAAAQVTESIKWLDGKLYGSTQVMDEGRHVEVFLRYLDTKMNRIYQINDNLFVIIDQLMTDSRWDMKFLGMQIMVEGLALGAFSNLYFHTQEPLLKELLKNVIQDEARHVHYGVLALSEHIKNNLNEKERKEREDWSFEVATLMKNRFLVHEVYEEWFEGRMKKSDWENYISNTSGMLDFRRTMFKRLIPNLKYIGLLSPRIQEKYVKSGLMIYADGKNASEITADELLIQ